MANGEQFRSPETVLENRERYLAKADEARKSYKQVMFRVNPLLREVKDQHFNPSVVSLGLFDRKTWNDATPKRENFKLDVAINFLADIGKEASREWKEVSEMIVEDPSVMKKLYNDFSELQAKESDFIRSALALDAILLTSHLVYEFSDLSDALRRLGMKLERTFHLFNSEPLDFYSEVSSDYFQVENQIPLQLIHNTIKVALESLRASLQRSAMDLEPDTVVEYICCSFISAVRNRLFPAFQIQKITMHDGLQFRECGHLLHCVAHAIRLGTEHEAMARESEIAVRVRENIERNHPMLLVVRVVTKFFSLFKCDGVFRRSRRRRNAAAPSGVRRTKTGMSTERLPSTNDGAVSGRADNTNGGTGSGRTDQSNDGTASPRSDQTNDAAASRRIDQTNDAMRIVIDLDEISFRDADNPGTLVTASDLSRNGITITSHDAFFPKLVPNRFAWWRATLYLPRISLIHSKTEQDWRNLLAFEAEYLVDSDDSSNPEGEKPFVSYLTFMNDLINTEEDVLLLHIGEEPVLPVIHLEHYQEVADLFNQVTTGHLSGRRSKIWNSIRTEIMTYHNWDTRVKIVVFTNTYFGRTWLIISVLAGFALLVLTSLQTLYSMLSYIKKKG